MKFRLNKDDGQPYVNYLLADVAISEGKTELDNLPPFVRIEVTSRCNLTCEHCWNAHYLLKGQDLDLTVFDRLNEEVLPSAATVQYTDLGEPFLYRHFDQVLEAIKSHHTPYTKIFTNGQILTPALARRVLESGLKELAVSVDGATEETYEKIRRGGSYARLRSNLDILKNLKKELNLKEPVFTFNVVVMKQNLEELDKLVCLAAEYEAVQIFFFNLHAITEEIAHRAPANFPKETRKAFLKAFEVGRNLNIEIRTDVDMGGRPPLERFHEITQHVLSLNHNEILIEATPDNLSFCEYPWKYISVKVNGSVHPCRFLSIPMGNLKGQRFSEIWNSPIYQQLRHSLLDGTGEFCIGAGCPYMAARCKDLRAEIVVHTSQSELEPGEIGYLKVRVRNIGKNTWNSIINERSEEFLESQSVSNALKYNLSYHLMNEASEVLLYDGMRVPLPQKVKPGEEVLVDLAVQAPNECGNYIINIDVVRENVTWLGSVGSTTCNHPLIVVRK